jgi:hypothetical protein
MVDLQTTGRAAAGGAGSAAKSWWPTRKWWVATVTAIGAIVVLWLNEGMHFDTAVGVAMVGAVVQAFTTYLLPNQDTPGGVPLRATGA